MFRYRTISFLLLSACILFVPAGQVWPQEEAPPPAAVREGADSGPRLAKIVLIDGKVEMQKPGCEWEQAAVNMSLGKDYVLRTGDDSLVRIELDDGSMVTLGEATTVSIIAMEEAETYEDKVSVFNLILGEIKAKVMKVLGKEARFEVQTSSCIVGVRGTEFVVTNQGGEASDVEVLSGSVVVEELGEEGRRGEPKEVKTGFWTRVEKDKPPLAAMKIQEHRKIKWKIWAQKSDILRKALQIEELKKERYELMVSFHLAKTPAGRRPIQVKIDAINGQIKRLSGEIEKGKRSLSAETERFKRDIAKAVEVWNRLTPEQRKKQGVRMDYEIWKMLNRQPGKIGQGKAVPRKKGSEAPASR